MSTMTYREGDWSSLSVYLFSQGLPIRSISYWYGHQLPQVWFSINLMLISLINFFSWIFSYLHEVHIYYTLLCLLRQSSKSYNVTFILIYDIFQYWILLSVWLCINTSLFFPLVLANFPLTLYSKSVCISIFMFVMFIFIVDYLYMT